MNSRKNNHSRKSTLRDRASRALSKNRASSKARAKSIIESTIVDTSPCLLKDKWTFLRADLNLKNEESIIAVYDIGTKLGKGAYGTVYLATNKITKENKAVKELAKQKFTQAEKEKLLKEFEILQVLTHPNILQVAEYFETSSKIQVVSDLYAGGELFDEVLKRKEFPEEDAAMVLRQLLSCMAYCNSKGVVHRDIKPENIMLDHQGDFSLIKLIDFGNATFFNPKTDKLMTARYGTPYYMAPEVINRSYDHRCDVWSIGVVGYILFCGGPPFTGLSNNLIFQSIIKGDLSFDRVNPESWKTVSDTAKNFITLLLTHDFRDRPSAAEILQNSSAQNFLKKANSPSRGVNRSRSRAASRTSFGKQIALIRGSISRSELEDAETELEDLNKKRKHTLQKKLRAKSEALKNLTNFRARQRLVHVVYSIILSRFMGQAEREELATVFQDWDKDHDGHLSKEELRKGIRKENKNLFNAIDFDDFFELMDHDGNGRVDYHEFLLATSNPKMILSSNNLNAVFDLLDTNKDGQLSLDEVKLALSTASTKKSEECVEEDAKLMIEEVDVDGDGCISREEFLRMMTSS